MTTQYEAEDRIHAAGQYVGRIRNEAKRRYAWRYLAWMCSPARDPARVPKHDGIGGMAAQAVEMELASILNGRGRL